MKQYCLLFLIIFFGFIIRFWSINNLPSILNRDEAALAYNAFLLQQTGMDEWQQRLPLIFLKSFGDYKLIGYPLTIILSCFFVGVNDLAVRLPSVISGTLIIFVAFLWPQPYGWSVFKRNLFSLLMAITPIFFFYSRMAYEANLGLLFTLVCLVIIRNILVNDESNIKQSVLLVFFALCAILSYNSPLIIFSVILGLLLTYRLFLKRKSLNQSIVALLLIVTIGWSVLIPLTNQKKSITIFNNPTTIDEWMQYRKKLPTPINYILGNRYIFFGRILGNNFVNSFSKSFLVDKGGSHPWHAIPNHGHIYLIVYLTFFAGLILMIYQVIKKHSLLILFDLSLIGIAIIPAIITIDAPHATRSLLLFFIISFIAMNLLQKCSHAIVYILFFTVVFIEAKNYYYSYFFEFPKTQGMFRNGLNTILADRDKDFRKEKIAFISEAGYDYILVAWYQKMKPEIFYSTINRLNPNEIGFYYVNQLDNFHFITRHAERNDQEHIMISWHPTRLTWEVQ